MANYKYKVVTECLRNDLQDFLGAGSVRLREGEVFTSPREIESDKFELVDYTPDPPKKVTKTETSTKAKA